MGLLAESTEEVFDNELIQKGFLICAKHRCWDKPKTGIVSSVSQHEIRVLHHPAIANVTCFFSIRANEVAEGQWEIRWSEDLTEVKEEIPEKDGQHDI